MSKPIQTCKSNSDLKDRALGTEIYPYVWRWKSKLPERYGQACIVQARGRMNTVRVYFPDGFFVFTSRWAVRLIQEVS